MSKDEWKGKLDDAQAKTTEVGIRKEVNSLGGGVSRDIHSDGLGLRYLV